MGDGRVDVPPALECSSWIYAQCNIGANCAAVPCEFPLSARPLFSFSTCPLDAGSLARRLVKALDWVGARDASHESIPLSPLRFTMPKLLAHLVVAALVVLGCRWLGASRGTLIGALVGGAILVHLIWERVFSNPFLYLGARPISPDDPVLLDAKAKAREAMPRLRELFPLYPKDTCVRFRFPHATAQDEFVWGDLVELGPERAKVYLRTPPKQPVQLESRTMDIAVDTIDDWQIEQPDGSLLGGYTNQALFKVYEREEGHTHPAFVSQMARFRDRLDGAPFAGVTWQVHDKPARDARTS